MTEPQGWVLIGIFATLMLGGMTLMTTLINRATASAIGGLRGEVGGLRGEIDGLRGETRSAIDGLRHEMTARFEAVDARFDSVNTRLDHIDKDVTGLMKRAWGEPRSE